MSATTERRRYTPPRPRAERETPAIRILDDRFADNLYALRRVRGITRAELQRATGICRHAIEKLECGNRGPGLRRRVSIGEAVVLAAALGVQPAELLKEPANTTPPTVQRCPLGDNR